MERTVPETVGEGIELYIRTYYSLLRSSGDIRIRSLEETHEGMFSSLHLGAESRQFDSSAFVYAALRLPTCMSRVRRVILGQSEDVFVHGGLTDIARWQRVDAPARRRRVLFDGQDTVAAFVSSVSDIDDLIPSLTAFQIEWNKLHWRLSGTQLGHDLITNRVDPESVLAELPAVLGISPEELDLLVHIWGPELAHEVRALASHPMDIRFTSLASGFNDYRKAVHSWWDDLVHAVEEVDLESRPVYFVSSNPHSLPNMLSGNASSQSDRLIDFVNRVGPQGMAEEWKRLQEVGPSHARANFLYYAMRSWINEDLGREVALQAYERESGIYRFTDPRTFDISAQIIELRALQPERLDERLRMPGLDALNESQALIVNVDYPLGFAAYHLFSKLASSVSELLGVYIMGKAASLNGRIGDVMIPNVVFDEHSRNTFLFKNSFLAQDIARFLVYGDVFDNQKSVTVRGTFLQNRDFMGVFYREGYTDIEMEAGPYLSGIYEDIYPRRYPVNEIVNLFINAPYDIGILHYASDTPYSRRQSLLSKSLSYFGVDATYACSAAILRRILAAELDRLGVPAVVNRA